MKTPLFPQALHQKLNLLHSRNVFEMSTGNNRGTQWLNCKSAEFRIKCPDSSDLAESVYRSCLPEQDTLLLQAPPSTQVYKWIPANYHGNMRWGEV